MKLVKACVALAAFAAIFVVPSVASAVRITAPTGTVYKGNVIATNVAHAQTPTQTVMTTSIGNVICGTATITGKITKAEGANVEGEISTANFAGTHGVTTTGHCAGSGLLGSHITPTPSHTSDELKSLPWCIRTGGDAFEVVGSAGGSECNPAFDRPITFTIHGALTCHYTRGLVAGNFTTHPAGTVLTVVEQEFHRFTSSAFCPPTARLDMAFTLAAENGGSEGSHIFIDAF